MIAMILKDVYKQNANGSKRRRTTEPAETAVPRAERVEEDESD
jgi:hypothetical protein